MRLPLLTVLVLTISGSAFADTYIVRPDGTGDFPTIQAAIDFASDGDIIELTNGTFTGPGNRDLDYLGKAITIRSQSGNPETCIIDCEEESRGFYFRTGEGPGSVLEGITITRGYVLTALGGAIRCSSADPTIRDCIFSENTAYHEEVGGTGGAISCGNSSVSVTRCTFVENTARYSPWGLSTEGGAMACFGGSPVVTDCMFIRNEAQWGGGGGIHCDECWITLEGCTFVENGPSSGGAVRFRWASGDIDGCWFERNEGSSVFAVWFGSSPTFDHCSFIANATSSGTVDCWEDSSPLFRSCTFHGNTGPNRGTAFWCTDACFPDIEHCIISFGGEGVPVWCDGTSGANLTCCDVYGNAGGDWVGCIADQLGMNGNICEHPLFCGPEVEDFTLAENSSCAPFTPPNPECDLIGAWPVGCGPASVPDEADLPGTAVTWGHLKSIFQHRRR